MDKNKGNHNILIEQCEGANLTAEALESLIEVIAEMIFKNIRKDNDVSIDETN